MSKSIAEHKLEGTYHSRHKEKEKVENYFSLQVINGTEIIPPDSIFNEDIKKQYIEHSKVLLKLKLINPMDIGSFNTMYESLQEAREIYKKMQACDKAEDLETYSEYVHLYTKLVNQFNTISRNFFVTPAVRQKMTLNELEIEQKKNDSAISKLLKK